MGRNEEIKCASKDYVNYLLDKQEYHNENYTEDDIRQAFEKGAMFADKNPDLSALWHSASEEPEGANWEILCQDEINGCWVENRIDAQLLHKNWNVYTEIEKIVRWAYIKDLLPKGGER